MREAFISRSLQGSQLSTQTTDFSTGEIIEDGRDGLSVQSKDLEPHGYSPCFPDLYGENMLIQVAHSTLKCNTLVKDLVWGIL